MADATSSIPWIPLTRFFDAFADIRGVGFSTSQSDLRYHWVHVRLAVIGADEMRELVEDAWAFVVPKRVAEEYGALRGSH